MTARRVRLGMLTPSSNTVLEPVVSAMLAGLPEVSAHFARFRVVEISLREQALGQFQAAPMLDAARLLADARVDVIVWNGTSSGWLGFDADAALCAAITAATAIPATTSVLALNAVMRLTGVGRFGLVTPYLHDVQARILANYAAAGFRCAAERHLNDPGNFSFSEVTSDSIAEMARAVAAASPDCIATFCTNLRAAPLVEALEREFDVPIYDTVSVAVWQALALAGVDPSRVAGWGRLFQLATGGARDMSRRRLRIAAALASVLTALVGSPAGAQPAGPVRAARHLVATANPLASEAARAVLRDGGSAVDAAVAAQMVLAVVEPQSSGLGGGSLLLVWDAGQGSLAYYDGLASAPAVLGGDLGIVRGSPASARPRPTGRLVGVPGTLRTLAAVHARYGRLPWARLFRDAIRIAEDGFALPPYLHASLLGRPGVAREGVLAALYFDGSDRPLATGTMLRNPALARTLRRVADGGPDVLYTGALAAGVIRTVRAGARPGTMAASDLAAYAPRERAPVCAVAFGHRMCSAAPPASGGIALLQQLVMLDRLGIAAVAPDSAQAAHLFIEAGRLAAADRRAWIGDPDQVAVPTDGLLDPRYLAARAALVKPDRAMDEVRPGDPPRRHGAAAPSDPVALPATTHLAIVDDAGNAVSFTTTINQNFGSERVSDGIILNDAMTNFAARATVDGRRPANAIAPGKRPVSTMAPSIVFGADGRPELIVGAGGGARIIDCVAETIIGVYAWHRDIRAAIAAPRLGAQNRAQELERDTPAAALAEALRAMGHDPKVVAMNAGVQAVMVTPGGLFGWADPRRDGVALGD